MRYAILLGLVGLLAMTGILLYAFTQGDFSGEGQIILSIPWGIVSLVDLYVGFFLFSGWIVYREKSWLVSLPWVAAMMVLGFFTASLYVIVAARQSRGDWTCFWMGKRAPQLS